MMTNNETKSRSKEIAKQERVTLDEITVGRLDAWLSQVVQQVPGIKIGRSELVRWLIGSHVETLNAEELQGIKAAYFDEMEFALWMVRQLRDSRARGEAVSLADLLGGASVVPTARPKKRKVVEAAVSEVARE